MQGNNWRQRREPFGDMGEFETEAGTHVEVGDTVLAKPTYVGQRVRATVERIYWDPRGLPGGKFDHRGEKVGEDDDGMPIYENPGEYDCIATVLVELHPEDEEWSHLDGKTVKIEGYNLDFVIGSGPEIRRDRGNCNAAKV